MEPWDPEIFLNKLTSGEFNSHMHDELLQLSEDQLQAIVQLLEDRKRRGGSPAPFGSLLEADVRQL